MNYSRIQCACLLLLATFYVTIYSQTNIVQNITSAPSANNFAYPQSVFVDSPNGHIRITDFDNHRVLRFNVSTLTSVRESHDSSSLSSYFLSQNYTNPFNPVTQITFSTKSAGVVILTGVICSVRKLLHYSTKLQTLIHSIRLLSMQRLYQAEFISILFVQKMEMKLKKCVC